MPKYNTQIMVRIDDIDIPNREVHCFTSQGSKVLATFRHTSAAFQIPQQGEKWLAEKVNYTWHLQSRWDNADEAQTKYSLNAGDVHLRVPGDLHTDANRIVTPAGGIGATTRDNLKGDGTTVAFVLSSPPVNEDSAMTWVNGVFMHPDLEWRLSGKVIVFNTPPANNAKITVHYQRSGASYRDSTAVTSIGSMQADDIFTL